MAQNPVVIVRTRNAVKHIDRFCKGYAWADHILIADGGSTDGTLERASKYPNVDIRHFHHLAWRNGQSRNPEGEHINFLNMWAHEIGADWIIMDDSDSVPNDRLQQDARRLFELNQHDIMSIFRLYIYGEDQFFPDLCGGWPPPMPRYDSDRKLVIRWQGLWGWHADLPLWWDESDPWEMQLLAPERAANDTFSWNPIDLPYLLLHYFCLDKQEIKRKLHLYRLGKKQLHMKYPTVGYGPILPLPEWVHP